MSGDVQQRPPRHLVLLRVVSRNDPEGELRRVLLPRARPPPCPASCILRLYTGSVRRADLRNQRKVAMPGTARGALGHAFQSYMRNDFWPGNEFARYAATRLHKPQSPSSGAANHAIRSVYAATVIEPTWTWPLLFARNAMHAWLHGVRVALPTHNGRAEFAAHVLRPHHLVHIATFTTRKTCRFFRSARKRTARA